MVAVPHAKGARGNHRQEGDQSTELDPGRDRSYVGDMYYFAGANTPKYDELALKREGGGRLTEEKESRLAGLGEVKVIYTGMWTGDEADEPVSGEEVVNVRNVKRMYMIKTRLVSYF